MFGSTFCTVVIFLTFPSFLIFRGKGLVIDAYSVWFHSGQLTKTSEYKSRFQQLCYSLLDCNQCQGCALTAPGRLRRLTFGLGRLKKKSGRPSGCLDFGLCEN